MLQHYIDLQLRSDPEFTPQQLMAALYARLHRVLAMTQASSIGVCFPGYGINPPRLGGTLRLLGPASDLARLMEFDWLRGVNDHVEVQPTRPIPATTEFRLLRRVQAKSSPERLRRRQMRRHGLTEEQARERVPGTVGEVLALPYVEMASASTGQRFRMFLRLEPSQRPEATGAFNTYGLSSSSGIPWF